MKNNKATQPTLCVVAGHSAGHILPARTLASAWLEAQPEGTCIFFLTDKQLDKDIVSQNPHSRIVYVHLALQTLSRKKWWELPSVCINFVRTCWNSYRLLSRQSVEKVITTGGYVAVPVCIAAKLLAVPIDLYELNAVPGKAVRLLSSIATTIYVCFADAQHYFAKKNCVVTTYPLQPSLQEKVPNTTAARTTLTLKADYTTILILGGSQGSLFINNLIKRWLADAAIMYKNIQIIHQTGSQDTNDWAAIYQKYGIPARVFPYCTTMHELYSAADIIICRSGAGSLFEAMHYKKICITIPLELLAGNHQLINAQALAQQHPERLFVLRQQDLTQDITPFIQTVQRTISHIVST